MGQTEPIRRRMLADMGIEVWLLREPPVPSQPELASDTSSADVVQSPPPGPEAAIEALTVTCLVSDSAMMLVDGVGPGVSRRLCRDLLASVTGQWRLSPREITFAWPAGGSQSDCWRAFKAFAEKQLSEQDVAVVMCSEALLERLPELDVGCKLLALPGLSEFGAAAKRTIWHRMQTLSP
ncbi:MAG: hypothetical protein VB948_00010 [Pseudomonadales bacterium]